MSTAFPTRAAMAPGYPTCPVLRVLVNTILHRSSVSYHSDGSALHKRNFYVWEQDFPREASLRTGDGCFGRGGRGEKHQQRGRRPSAVSFHCLIVALKECHELYP